MIKVSPVQKGNNVLNYISQSSWCYEESITADYEVNNTTAILFLSLRFHSCKPEYIFKRINRLKKYKVGILLVHVDVSNYEETLLELFNMVPLSIVLGFTTEECSRYIQGFNLSGSRSISVLRRKENDRSEFLNSFPSINKTDVKQILEKYENLKVFLEDPSSGICLIKGFGETKVQEIVKYVNMNFK